MAVIDNKNTILYLAHERLAEWGDIVVESSVRKSRVYQNKAEKLRYFLKAMEHEFYLEDDDITSLLQCINNLAELTDWPTAPVLAEKQAPVAITGVPGPIGPAGVDGVDGSDADINVVSGDSVISIVETAPGGVKTFTVSYAPYTAPTISLAITTSGFPNPSSLIQELGTTLTTVPFSITLNKGKDTVDSSTLTSPADQDGDYQAALDLVALNAGTEQIISLDDTNVTATQIYSAEIDDLTNQPSSSKTITFVIPFLYGSSGTALVQSTYISNLTKLIQTQGNKAILFNDTDAFFYFVYDANYPDLDSILDGNGFEAIGAFTKTTETVDMVSGPESMKVYKTIITDIPSQTYTFKF